MAKDKITEYDATASNNTVVGDVNLAENSALPSDMNNAIREVMSHQKEAFGSGTPLFVDQTNNRVGVNNSSPTVALDVSGQAIITTSLTGQANDGQFEFISKDTSGSGSTDYGDFIFKGVRGADGDSVTIMNMDGATGRVGINTTSMSEPLRVQADSGTDFSASSANFNTAIMLKNSTAGASNCVSLAMATESNGEVYLSTVQNSDNDASDFVISTRDSGARAERLRVTSAGTLLIGKTQAGAEFEGLSLGAGFGTFTRNSAVPVFINRHSNDGTLVELRQANTNEGTISVSGTTVSYNGGHLSRWSQLTDNTRDDTIVKGTVMTNLNQMAEWTTDGVTEDNEQLNCMAISSVEGDINVAGVFVNWDDDDNVYKNDMNVAMTGDMVIRIAKGTKVARGDLLMSAGDGTAKPQGDDIVRSKTIAKVTSTNVSHTYDDGTYLVPCVVMAC